MENRSIYTAKAFTSDPQGGNAAAVVPDAAGLSDDQMQAVAHRIGFSETAFALPPETAEAAFRLRWFTPAVEVPLCGHATIATLKVLAEEGILPADGSARKIETRSGLLRVRVAREIGRLFCFMQVPVPEFSDLEIPEDKAKTLFGLYAGDRMPVWPTVKGRPGPYIPVISIATLRKLRPDFARMKCDPDFGEVCFFTGQTLRVGNTWHCRFFAPGFGIDEDPVTGSANGPLGAYWYRFVDTKKPARAEYIGEQGDLIGCPGRVYVTVQGDGAVATDIEIGGEAVIVGRESLDDIMERLART